MAINSIFSEIESKYKKKKLVKVKSIEEFEDRIIAVNIEVPKIVKTSGGIIIPTEKTGEDALGDASFAEVVRVGSEINKNIKSGRKVKEGDILVVDGYAGKDLQIGSIEFRIFRLSDIICYGDIETEEID